MPSPCSRLKNEDQLQFRWLNKQLSRSLSSALVFCFFGPHITSDICEGGHTEASMHVVTAHPSGYLSPYWSSKRHTARKQGHLQCPGLLYALLCLHHQVTGPGQSSSSSVLRPEVLVMVTSHFAPFVLCRTPLLSGEG